MGLLTDPSAGQSRIPRLLVGHHHKICLLFYIGGLVWFSLLAYRSCNAGTYFSENALLPGLVKGEFDEARSARDYLESLTQESDNYQHGIPFPWLLAKFRQLGLDTYTHNFTLHYPMGMGTKYMGKNVYGILRAPRSSSTEALVLSVPYRTPASIHTGTSPSIALMMSLAKFFRKHSYWAKDIIFLVTEHEQLGMQAWLEAYHQVSCGKGILDHGDMEGRSGSIQAALNLEIHSDKVSHIDVKVEGLNGQLPNLDLVNLVHRLCIREGVVHTFKDREDPSDSLSFDGWLHSVRTLLSMVSTQATGVPNGNHGLFHRFGIEAVTVVGVNERGRSRVPADFHTMGRIVEGIFRSLNNLLERFHQSFFFYLLPATNRYISIGLYMPPFGLLAGSLLIKALALWFKTTRDTETEELLREKNVASKREETVKQQKGGSLFSIIPVVILTHTVGVIFTCCPELFSKIGVQFSLKSEDSIYLGFLALSLSVLVLPFYIRRHSWMSQKSWKVLKCVALLELSAALFAVAMYNFSLALLVTTLYVPVCVVITPIQARWLKYPQALFHIVIHPFTLLLLLSVFDSYRTFPEAEWGALLEKSFNANKRALMYSIVDGYVYGNWLFEVACSVLLPVWLLFWVVLMTDVYSS